MSAFFISIPPSAVAAVLAVWLVSVGVVVWACRTSKVNERLDGGNDEWLRGAKR